MIDLESYRDRQLVIFAEKSRALADRVAAGQLRLVDAADMLQSAADISGLVDLCGDDAVQSIMARAFTEGRRTDA